MTQGMMFTTQFSQNHFFAFHHGEETTPAMKLFNILVIGLGYASASTERGLMESEPCLDLEELPFDRSSCSASAVMAVVSKELAKVSCPQHNLRQEILLLTDTSDVSEAKYILTQVCKGESYQACTSWEEVAVNGCDFESIMEEIESRVEGAGEACTHDAVKELLFLTDSKNIFKAQGYIDVMCGDAWSKVARTKFTDIDARFDDDFMSEYFDGKTFLNTETGNFQGNENPQYPASEDSLSAGQSIAAFRKGGATTTVLTNDIPDLQCQNQAMMCCFGRDRQSNDNNGDCADNDCADKGPADNSNLCYTDFPTIVPFPNQSEGAIHCHGVAWGADDNGVEAKLKYNNLFYVSMYDHMYTRGYVEKTVPNDYVPMCGCIEDMPPVSRADCTEVTVTLTFTVSQDSDGFLYAEPEDDLDVQFAACEGIDFTNGGKADNDLASYANVLVRDGKMKVRTQRAIFETLVGFKSPGDNANEQSCKVAYRKETGGLVYPKA
jgi:hypothetical protein